MKRTWFWYQHLGMGRAMGCWERKLNRPRRCRSRAAKVWGVSRLTIYSTSDLQARDF